MLRSPKVLKSKIKYLLILVLPMALHANSVKAADAENGKKIFAQCAGCHQLGPDAKHLFGPGLHGTIDSAIASADGYEYSPVFQQANKDGATWTKENLDAFLSAPMQTYPGTKMVYPGLSKQSDRDDVIAYLESLSSAAASDESETVKVAEVEAVETPRPLAKDAVVPTHGVLHLGRAALAEEISAWDIDVRPDGLGLPEGSGTVTAGESLYDTQCASCHGVFGEGEGRWPVLAGGEDTLTEDRPEKTIGSYWPYLSTVYDYVKRAMPFGNARSLSDDDVYALTAYLLFLNDLADEDFELSHTNFSDISLPNVDNFIPDSREEEPDFVMHGEPCMSDCIAGQVTVSQRARVLDVTPDTE